MAAVFALVGVPMAFLITIIISLVVGHTLGISLGATLIAGMMTLFVVIIRFVHDLEDETV